MYYLAYSNTQQYLNSFVPASREEWVLVVQDVDVPHSGSVTSERLKLDLFQVESCFEKILLQMGISKLYSDVSGCWMVWTSDTIKLSRGEICVENFMLQVWVIIFVLKIWLQPKNTV